VRAAARRSTETLEAIGMPTPSAMPTVPVKRFVQMFPEGATHYSIRRRADGLFQIYHDDPNVGIEQPYQFDDRPMGGLFADVEAAEAELLRIRPTLEPVL
jgi:hypothetical protein